MIEYIISFASLYFLTYLLLTYLEEEWEEPYSKDIRDRKVDRIDVYFE